MSLSSVSSTKSNENTTVSVSGSRFCIVPSLYRKVEKLKWQQRRGTPHLNASADVFEILLRYLMFNKLPETTGMTSRQASELVKMVKPLDNVDALVEHVKIFLTAKDEQKQNPSFLRRRLSSLSLKNKAATGEDKLTKAATTTTSTDAPTATPSVNEVDTLDVFGLLGTTETDPSVNETMDDVFNIFGLENDSPNILNVDLLPNLEATMSTDSEGSSRIDQKTYASTDGSASCHNSCPLKASELSLSEDFAPIPATTMVPKPAYSSDSTHTKLSSSSRMSKSLHNVFQKIKGKDVSRTHAELCASEFVL